MPWIVVEKSLDYSNLSDEALMTLVERRDPEAVATLYDRYGSLVFSLVLRVLNDPQVAEEVTQDTFLNMWRNAPAFRPSRGRFSSWLLTIARNRAIDELRRYRSRSRTEEAATAEFLAEDDLERRSSFNTQPQLQRIAVEQALEELPEAQRQVIQLAYFGGFTQREIAEHLDEPLGTIKTRIRLGLQRLRGLLANQEEEPSNIES